MPLNDKLWLGSTIRTKNQFIEFDDKFLTREFCNDNHLRMTYHAHNDYSPTLCKCRSYACARLQLGPMLQSSRTNIIVSYTKCIMYYVLIMCA